MPAADSLQKQSPFVVCVILNWNGWRDTTECLASLREQSYDNLQVLVVDNASTDDSVARIRSCFPEIEVMEMGSNLGYSKGCNAGIRVALERNADYIWLLNNDTICPADTVAKLVGSGERIPEAGLIGTVLYYAHDPSKVQAWGGGHVNPWFGYVRHYYTPHDFAKDDYLTFASVLVRKQAVLDVGMLYEGAFMYYDDSDFCQRMQRTKWTIAVAADTAVLHKEGGSTPKTASGFIIKTITVSGLRFLRRFSPLPWFSIPVFVLLRAGKRVRKGELKGLKAVFQAFFEFLREPMPR